MILSNLFTKYNNWVELRCSYFEIRPMKKSIKQTIEKIIRDNDFLEDGLYHGYVNLTSLSSYLLATIQKMSGKKTTVGSVTMTLSRIAQDIQKTTLRARIRPEDMRIRTGISYVNFTKEPWLTPALNDISTKLVATETTGSQLFSQLEGSREVTVLFTPFYASVIAEICERFPPKVMKHDFVSLVIHIPAEYLEQKGFLYYVVKQLNYFWVNIIELYTTQTELSILISKEDITAAMNILA